MQHHQEHVDHCHSLHSRLVIKEAEIKTISDRVLFECLVLPHNEGKGQKRLGSYYLGGMHPNLSTHIGD